MPTGLRLAARPGNLGRRVSHALIPVVATYSSNMGSFFKPPPSDIQYIQQHFSINRGDIFLLEHRPPVRAWFHPGQDQLYGYNTWYIFSYAAAGENFVGLRFLRIEEWWGRYSRQQHALDTRTVLATPPCYDDYPPLSRPGLKLFGRYFRCIFCNDRLFPGTDTGAATVSALHLFDHDRFFPVP